MPINNLEAKAQWDGRSADDGRLDAWRLYVSVHRELVSALEEEMEREFNFGLTWFEVLTQLNAAEDGRMSMTELAEAVVISKGGLTKLVDRMEYAGLVARESRAGDRRVNDITMTAHGKAEFGRASALHDARVAELFLDRISRTQARAMFDALSAIQMGLQQPALRQRKSG